MIYSATIQEDDEGQFVVLPEAYRLDTPSVWMSINEQTGIITVTPRLSETSENSEEQRLRDIQTMTEMIAGKANAANLTGNAQ